MFVCLVLVCGALGMRKIVLQANGEGITHRACRMICVWKIECGPPGSVQRKHHIQSSGQATLQHC